MRCCVFHSERQKQHFQNPNYEDLALYPSSCHGANHIADRRESLFSGAVALDAEPTYIRIKHGFLGPIPNVRDPVASTTGPENLHF